MEVLKFPATNAALWHPKPTGSPVFVHATYYRLPLVILEERTVRLALRFSQNRAENDYFCNLVASVTSDPDAEGVRISVDHIDPECKNELPPTEDLLLKCMVRKDSSIAASSEHYKAMIKIVQDGCLGKNHFGLRDVMSGMMTCYNQQGQSHIIYCDLDIVLPKVVFKATPIQAVPIVTTALSKNLAGPMSLSEVQGEAKSGFLTMDQTHKLLLILASDPKAASLPLVGIWVSGVALIHDPFVWRSCLNYQFSSILKNRVCRSPEPFLIVLYSSLRSKPEFYQCVTTEGQTDLSFELYSCHEVIHLPKKSSDRPASPLELELTLVNSGRKMTLFESALGTLHQNLPGSASLDSTPDEGYPWKRPTPLSSKTAVVQPSVSEVTLLYEDFEPRPHPSAQAPYPSPQPFAQPPKVSKNKSKERRKSVKSPQRSASEMQVHNSPNLHSPHPQQSTSDSSVNVYQIHGASVNVPVNSNTPAHVHGPAAAQGSSPYVSNNVGSGNESFQMRSAFIGQQTPMNMHPPVNSITQESANRTPHNFLHQGIPSCMDGSINYSPNCGSNQDMNVSSVSQSNSASTPMQGGQFLNGVPVNHQAGFCINSPHGLVQGVPTSRPAQGVHNLTPAGCSMGQNVHVMPSHSDPRFMPPYVSTNQTPPMKLNLSDLPTNQTLNQTPVNHCGGGDVMTPRTCDTSGSQHSEKSNASSHFSVMSPQLTLKPVSSDSTQFDSSDCAKKQSCCCNCSVSSGTSNHSGNNIPVPNVNHGGEKVNSPDRKQGDGDLYTIVRQQEAQIQMLREQISLLLAKQEDKAPLTETPVSVVPTNCQTSDYRNQSVGCNTSTNLLNPSHGSSGPQVNTPLPHSSWHSQHIDLTSSSNSGRSYHGNPQLGFNSSQNSGHTHSSEDYPNTSNSMNTTKDHSEDASSLSFGEFDMNQVHNNSQESIASTMVLDLPEYGPVSPDRSVYNNHSSAGSEMGDISPVPSESVSTCERLMTGEHSTDPEEMNEDSRDTGLGDSNIHASLLLNDNRRFYKNVLENVYKHFMAPDYSNANDTVVSAPDPTTQRSEVDEGIHRSYDDCLATPLKSPPRTQHRSHKSKQPANVAQVTKEALAQLGIELEKQSQAASTKRDNDSVFLDLAKLPRAEYMAMLDTDSECSMEMDVLAMKYLKDDQLADLAKSRGRKSRHNHVPVTPSKSSVSNMSLTSRKYLERYGILDADNQSAITAVTDHSLRLPTLFNVQEFLQKLSETSSVVGGDGPSDVSRCKSSGSGSEHSANSRQSSNSRDPDTNRGGQHDPSQMTLNEMGQFLGLSKAFKGPESRGQAPDVQFAHTPHSGHMR